MDIYIEREFERLNSYRDRWNDLARLNCTGSIFQTYEWNRSWWDIFKDLGELSIIIAKEGKELVGIAPLMIVNERQLFRETRIVQFIGTGMSDYCDFLADNNSPDILLKMIDYLFREKGSWDGLRLINISEKSISRKIIEERFRNFGLKKIFVHQSDCPALSIKDNLMLAKKISTKESLLRRSNYFRKRGHYEILHLMDPNEIEKYLCQFFEQHISRWKNSPTPSLFLEKRNRRFYEDLVKSLCGNNWLVFSIVNSMGIPIAFHFGFDYNNVLTWYKPTFNPAFSKYSPGQVLLKELLDYAIDNGKDEFDFTVGNEPFKRRFSNTIRRNQSFLVYQGSIRSKIEGARLLVKQISSYAFKNIIINNLFTYFYNRQSWLNHGNGGLKQTDKVPTLEGVAKKRINLLYLIDTLKDGGGTETHLVDVAARLNKNKFNCLICAFDSDRGPFVRKIEEKTRVECIPVGRFYGFIAFLKAFKLMKLIRDNDIDIVQTFHFKSDTYGVLVSRLAGVQKIISSRRDLGDLKKDRHIRLNRFINPFIDYFIMVCNSVREVVRNLEGVPDDKMTTIYNGVQLGRFQPVSSTEIDSLKRKLNIPDGAFVIGSVAYFRPEKAYHIFFEAIEKIKDSVKDWVVLILGDGPLENHFKELCRVKGIGSNVKFMGSVLDAPKYIALMDIVCLVPNKNEGFSNAILESMAMKKPVIATNVGGNAEAVKDGETGIIIPPDNVQGLVNAIIKLYNDIDLRKEMGEMGRKRVEEYFVLEDMIRKMEQFYLQIYRESKH